MIRDNTREIRAEGDSGWQENKPAEAVKFLNKLKITIENTEKNINTDFEDLGGMENWIVALDADMSNLVNYKDFLANESDKKNAENLLDLARGYMTTLELRIALLGDRE